MNFERQLACAAERVARILPSRDQQMCALIAEFGIIAGVSMDCPTLEALAQQYACVDRTLQLPALLALAEQIVGGLSANVIYVISGNWGGRTPPVTPTTPTATGYDVSTSPTTQWAWFNGSWHSVASGVQQVFSGIGSPVGVVFPTASSAIYFDNTVPSQPNVWYWSNSIWTEFIGV